MSDIQLGKMYKSKERDIYVIPLRKEEKRLTGEIVNMGVEAYFPLAEFLFAYEVCREDNKEKTVTSWQSV